MTVYIYLMTYLFIDFLALKSIRPLAAMKFDQTQDWKEVRNVFYK